MTSSNLGKWHNYSHCLFALSFLDRATHSMSFTPRFTITNSMTAGLTRIERARGFLDAAHLSDDWIRSMGQRALLLEAHHTRISRGLN